MSDRTIVIAEAGVNHNGSLETAFELVDVAADAGADYVKFQTFKADQLVTRNAPRAEYQIANMGDGGTQHSMLMRLELSVDAHHELLARSRSRSIGFMSTAFDSESLAFLATLDMAVIKIPSGDITCAPLLLQAARLRKPLIVSTGMSTLEEIEAALGVIAFGLIQNRAPERSSEFNEAFASKSGKDALRERVTLLHCVTQYPAPPEDVNLRAMETMRRAFSLPVGYSDHTLGIAVPIAAVACGARVIEKHFTLSRKLSGPDHAASLEPAELAEMIAGIRTVESALGTSQKRPTEMEIPNRTIARRSLVAAKDIRRGEVFSPEMLVAKRPGSGISPMALWDLVGTTAARDYVADEIIEK
jgi:N-acetylneuraminate synthase